MGTTYFNTDNHDIDIYEYRAAKAAVFKLDEKDLEKLLGSSSAFRLTHDDN